MPLPKLSRSLAAGALLLTVCMPSSAQTPVKIKSEELLEGSGLARSKRYPGVFWTHNDSGDSARLFAIDRRGKQLGEWRVSGARNQDWEAVAIDDQGRLYIGDIGNNANARRDLAVYIVEEPDPATGGGTIPSLKRLRYRFPDLPYPPPPNRRNYDAEAMFWTGGNLYLLSKHRSNTQTRLYRFRSLSEEAEQVLEALGEPFDTLETGLPRGGMVTAADLSDDGKQLAVLTYHHLFIFDDPEQLHLSQLRSKTRLVAAVAIQCEGLAWDGEDLVFSNEQGFLHRLPGASAGLGARYPSSSGASQR
ncbi:MAG: hypothetical protein AAF690_05205 [Acidobacteriota bacterium]